MDKKYFGNVSKNTKNEIFRLSEFGKLEFLKMKGVNGSDIFLLVFSMCFFVLSEL